jgi:uncharacterized protein (DUF4213/DUF364 family)
MGECCRVVSDAGALAGRHALDYLNLADSWDIGERIIGIATMNALSNIFFETYPFRYSMEEKNLIEHLELLKEDVCVMVGLIRPFVPFFRSKAFSS